MLAIAFGLIYLAAVLAALAYFGEKIARILAPQIVLNAGLHICFGIAAFTAFCGILEITRWANREIFLALIAAVAIGQTVAVLKTRKSRTALAEVLAGLRRSPPLSIMAFSISGFLFAAFLINASIWHYGFIDDLQGYLIFPERILEEGSIGRDLFNFRRIETGLTGSAYIYALFRAGLEIPQTRLADVGVGSACLLLLVYGQARDLGLSGVRLAGALLIALAVAAFSPIINNTPETIGKAMLLGFVQLALAFEGKKLSVRHAAALGIFLFACIGLKTTYLPEAAAIMAAYYLCAAARNPWTAVARSAVAAALVALICMSPWMIVSHAIAGTFWYPLLGHGTLSGDETAGIVSFGQLVRDGGRLGFFLLPAFLGTWIVWRQPDRRATRFFYAAVTVCSVVLIILSQLKFTVFGYRYGHAGAAAIMLFFVPIILQSSRPLITRSLAALVLALCIVIMALSKTTPDRWLEDGLLARNGVMRSEVDDAARDKAIKELRAMQSSVPAGQPLLALLSDPAFLDFRRQPIATMDHAGKMGPPGMPDPADAAGWANYLKSLGIRYVAYSYRDEAIFNSIWAAHVVSDFSKTGAYSRFMVEDARAGMQLRRSFIAFRTLGDTVYDDGSIFVVYLPDRLRNSGNRSGQ